MTRINYRVPQVEMFIKLTKDISYHWKKVGSKGEVHKVVEYIEADARRTKGRPIVRIYNWTLGQVIGLYHYEFVFCNKKGEVDEKAGSTV